LLGEGTSGPVVFQHCLIRWCVFMFQVFRSYSSWSNQNNTAPKCLNCTLCCLHFVGGCNW